MTEFVSELERIMPAEEIVFEPTPGFGPYKQYFPDAAVSHPAKANTILVQHLIEKFTKEGDTVIDPMAGSGSTGVIAALHGRNAILVDIEEKFVKWMLEAKKIVDGIQTLTEKGKITILKGDARQLSRILKEVDSIVTSPPYSGTFSSSKAGKKIRSGKSEIHDEKNLARPYTEDLDKSNIGNLSHGKISEIVDCCITSPPYGDARKHDRRAKKEEALNKIADKLSERSGNHHTPGRMKRIKADYDGYGENTENIGNLPVGDIDAVITSPPYSGSVNAPNDPERRAERMKKAGLDPKTIVGGKARCGQVDWKYGNSKENIGNLSHGEIDAVITSPPYSSSALQDYGTSNKALLEFEKMVRECFRTKGYFEYNGKKYTEEEWREINKGELKPRGIPELWAQIIKQRRNKKYNDEDENNIANLTHGEISAIITSPPYLKSADAGAGVNKQREGDVKIGCATKGREVSDPEAVDNAKEYGEIDAVITSPPYDESMSEKRHATPNTGRTEKLYQEKSLGSYPHSENQIGSMKKETYLEAMLNVYSEMFKVLRKGGRAIIIVKPFIRQKKVVDLVYHTWLLMQKAGFKLEKVLKLRLKQESFWRILYYRRFPDVPKIKHEYIIIARK